MDSGSRACARVPMTTSSSRSIRPSCMARIRALLARSGLSTSRTGPTQATLRRVIVFYGAKGGVGSTTLAINTAIALAAEHKRRVALVDANLQFGDLRVFLDLKLDTASIVNAITSPSSTLDLLRRLMVSSRLGDRPAAGAPAPRAADVVMENHRQTRPMSLTACSSLMRGDVRLHRHRRLAGARRRHHPALRRGGRRLRGDDRRPVVPEERPARAQDDERAWATRRTRCSSC